MPPNSWGCINYSRDVNHPLWVLCHWQLEVDEGLLQNTCTLHIVHPKVFCIDRSMIVCTSEYMAPNLGPTVTESSSLGRRDSGLTGNGLEDKVVERAAFFGGSVCKVVEVRSSVRSLELITSQFWRTRLVYCSNMMGSFTWLCSARHLTLLNAAGWPRALGKSHFPNEW